MRRSDRPLLVADAWRRGVAFMLDGLRTEAAHSLPTGPLTSQQVYEVMAGLTGTP